MPNWGKDYFQSLSDRFDDLVEGLDDRLEDVVAGRVAPAVDDLTIGSARKLRAAVLFFDIRGFSSRTGSAELNDMKRVLYLLDCVVPMVMHVVYDHGGYIEKNTGDGIMAVIGAEAGTTDAEAANAALDVATTSFYMLEHLVNPHLEGEGIEAVNARIGIDLGTLLVARIGLPKGTAKQERSFLTAVGPAANLACHLQQMADTNQIWAGDLVATNARADRQNFFKDKTPEGWTWTYKGQPSRTYNIWHYNAVKTDPD